MASDKVVINSRFRRVIQLLEDKTEVVAAYLFGSHVDGSADEYSDWDIALFVDNYQWWTLMRQVRISCKIKEAEGDDLDLHFFDASQLPNPSPASFAGWVVKNGVRIG